MPIRYLKPSRNNLDVMFRQVPPITRRPHSSSIKFATAFRVASESDDQRSITRSNAESMSAAFDGDGTTGGTTKLVTHCFPDVFGDRSSPGGGALKEPVFCCICNRHGLFRALLDLVAFFAARKSRLACGLEIPFPKLESETLPLD